MPRSSSNTTPARIHVQPTPTAVRVENSMTLGQSLKAGIGMSLGQRLVSGVLGPPTTEVRTVRESRCKAEKAAMEACVQRESTFDGCERMIRTYHACLND